MDVSQGKKANQHGDEETKSAELKLKQSDVVVKVERTELSEMENEDVKTEATCDELVGVPSTSSDSKDVMILKRKIKRRLSDEMTFNKTSKAMQIETEDDDKKPLALLIIKKAENAHQREEVKTEQAIELKDEVKEEPEDKKKDEKPVVIKLEDEMKIEMFRRIPKNEDVKIENGTEREFGNEDDCSGRETDVKPDPMELLKSQKVHEEEHDFQVKTELKNEIKDEAREEPVVEAGAEDKSFAKMMARVEVKKDEPKKKPEENVEEDSMDSFALDQLKSRQTVNNEIEPQSLRNAEPSSIVIADSDDEISEVPDDINLPSASSSTIDATEEDWSQCPHCQRIFPSEALCKKHIREQCKKRFKCRVCKKRFSYLCHLTTHLRIHLKEKPFVCGVNGCEKRFTHEGNVVRHRLIHTGVKPFVCGYNDCGKSYAHRSALVRHKGTHSGERSFVCDYEGCGKAFALNRTLFNHQQIHAAEKSYICNVAGCGKAFRQRSVLYSHSKIHTGQKSFVCEYVGCGKAFSQYPGLYQHKRNHQNQRNN